MRFHRNQTKNRITIEIWKLIRFFCRIHFFKYPNRSRSRRGRLRPPSCWFQDAGCCCRLPPPVSWWFVAPTSLLLPVPDWLVDVKVELLAELVQFSRDFLGFLLVVIHSVCEIQCKLDSRMFHVIEKNTSLRPPSIILPIACCRSPLQSWRAVKATLSTHFVISTICKTKFVILKTVYIVFLEPHISTFLLCFCLIFLIVTQLSDSELFRGRKLKI